MGSGLIVVVVSDRILSNNAHAISSDYPTGTISWSGSHLYLSLDPRIICVSDYKTPNTTIKAPNCNNYTYFDLHFVWFAV